MDGQQRLTSVLLGFLGLFPDKATFKATIERIADTNDDEIEADEELLDNILKWDFRELTKKGKNRNQILANIIDGNYKVVNFDISDDFLKNTFLGFSYLVPTTDNKHQQLKYYSSVFRNINIQGEPLLPQESRASLYFLDETRKEFFDPLFINNLVVKNFSSETKADFVRFLSLLSQYAKDGGSGWIARGYKSKMESYYEEYIYSVVGEQSSQLFKDFSAIFPNNQFQPRMEELDKAINDLDIPKLYHSIIEIDVYMFGLIYFIVFENQKIDLEKSAEIKAKLEEKITEFKSHNYHKKAPGALKYLRERIDASIEIYSNYING